MQAWLRGSLVAQVVTRPGISNIQTGAVPENESLHGSKIRNALNGIAFYEDAWTLVSQNQLHQRAEFLHGIEKAGLARRLGRS
jgi:hypothetical protein